MIRKIAAAATVALTIIVCALAIWSMREAIQLLLASLALSSALSPLIGWLEQRGLAHAHAIALAFLVMLGTLLASTLLLGGQIIGDLGLAIERAPSWYDRVRAELVGSPGWATVLGTALPTSSALVSAVLSADITEIGMVLANTVTQAFVLALLLISAASLGFYWLADQQQIERLWLSLLPLHLRTTTRAIWNQAYQAVGLYLRRELAIVGVSTLLLLGAYRLLGVPGAGLLALVGGLAQVVPVIGMPLAILPGMLVAATQGWVNGLLALGGGVATLGLTRIVVMPRLLKEQASINPVLVIVLIMALAELAGIWAMLFAPPLAAAVQAAIQAMRAEQLRSVPAPSQIETLDLERRLDEAEAQIEAQPAAAPHLRDLLARARKLVGEYALIQPGR